MDAASSWTHSASTPRSSIYAGPGTTPAPPRQHQSPECAPRHRQSPAGFSTIPHPRPPDDQQSVQPAYGETVTPAPRSVWPPRHLRKANPPDGPSGLRPPLMESPLRGRYPPLHKPSTAQAGHKRRQGRPTRPTRHYPLPSWRRPPMTTQATTTYDELCPAVTKPTAPTGCKAHRPWTPERAATAASNGRLTSSSDRIAMPPRDDCRIPVAAVPSSRT
jgi:hypothetical protein